MSITDELRAWAKEHLSRNSILAIADRIDAEHERHHYHAPTVEDVLFEFGMGWHEQMNGPETFDIADYIERFAAKLQLRED